MAFTVKVKIGKETDLKKILDYVKREAKEAGVNFEGTTKSGQFSGKISGSYTVKDGIVTLYITDKPWYVPESMIREKLKDLFKSC